MRVDPQVATYFTTEPEPLPRRGVTAGSAARRMPPRPALSARLRHTPAATKVTGTFTSLDDTCPAGTRQSRTLYQDGFEKGDLPEPTLTAGFTVAEGLAAEGTRFAQSSLSSATAPAPDKQYHALFLPVLTTSPTSTTVLSLKVRGDYGADTAYIAVNDGNGWIAPSPEWGQVTIDVSSALASPGADRAPGEMDLRFLNYPQTITGTTTLEVDDVQVYLCEPPAATGIRGDFDGDGISDLVGVDTAGVLWATPGRRNGTLGKPFRIGYGWNSMTWLGSPGDLTGDRRPDLLARRNDGVLLLYAGHGMGSFSQARPIGVGWRSMNAIVTPGDTDGDGVPELMARDRLGRLIRWDFAAGGRGLRSRTQVGVGFGVYATMLAPGDLNLDGRGEIVGIRTDGVMLGHYPDAQGRLGRARGMSQGWKPFTAVVGPGDLNGDRRGDLVARRADGSLWSFLTAAVRATGIPAASDANRFRLFG